MGETALDPETVAAVQHVEHAYDGGRVPVLTDVSLDVAAGELTAIVGPNGSGKSTFLRILSGVLDPAAGSVVRAGPPRPDDGSPATGDPGRGRTVGWLPQRLAPRGSFTVRETVAYYAGLVDPGPAADEALARVGMGNVADRRVDALSGGMRRLLGIALATVGSPPLLVLDEPTSGLDPTMTMRIFGILSELASDGRAVVCASHDLAAVERTADTVVLLDRGEIRACGSPAEVAAVAGAGSLAEAFDGAFGETDAAGEPTVRSGARS